MRKFKLAYPWWAHLPYLTLCLWIIYRFFSLWPELPPKVAVHFGIRGYPDRYGSPWEALFVFILPLLVYGLIGRNLEMVARRPKSRKPDLAILLVPSLAMGFLLPFVLDYLTILPQSMPRLSFPWYKIIITTACLSLFHLFVEWARPDRSNDFTFAQPVVEPEVRAKAAMLPSMAHKHSIYWETQNSLWLNLLILTALVMVIIPAWNLPFTCLTVLILIPLLGGLKYILTPSMLTIRYGILAVPVRKINLTDIRQVEVFSFNPLLDFGGWGIRYGRGGIWGYFLKGSAGVLLTLKNKKRILLGSDDPSRLAAVIENALKSTAL